MIFDAWGFLTSAPHWLVYLTALIGVLLGGWWISTITRQISSMVATVDNLGEMCSGFSKHAEQADKHYKDVERVASDEHWKNCDINKCIHFQQIFNKMDKIQERFDQFDQRANETRANTVTSLDGLREGQKELGRDLGRELGDLAKTIITVLAEDLKRRER